MQSRGSKNERRVCNSTRFFGKWSSFRKEPARSTNNRGTIYEFIRGSCTKRYVAEIPQDIDEFIIPLEKRNLIERSIEKIKQVYITDSGKKILPKIKFERKIDTLTPEIIQNKEWRDVLFKRWFIMENIV